MRKAKSKKPGITHAQLAAQPFEPVKEFVDLNSNLEMKERHEAKLQDIAVVSRMAIHRLGLPKTELIENMRKMVAENGGSPKSADEMLKCFVTGRELTKVLLKLIETAEIRFASAMANVFDEDGTMRGTVH
jgi:hypothetical protein